MRLAVPDLISNSYFPAIAAVELGFFQEKGLDVQLDLVFPVPKAMAAMRAVRKAQKALRADPSRATQAARRRFPPHETELIAELITRDLPYYDPTISAEVVTSLNRFAQHVGLLSEPVLYEQVVAVLFSHLWES